MIRNICSAAGSMGQKVLQGTVLSHSCSLKGEPWWGLGLDSFQEGFYVLTRALRAQCYGERSKLTFSNLKYSVADATGNA